MVFINDKKFACATCIKGHRVSGCTHTDRALYEIKKKGRPSSQCIHCKDKRKGNNTHVKCPCGDFQQPEILPPNSVPSIPESSGTSGASNDGSGGEEFVETKKGQPGSSATFPNGLRDVHEMSATLVPRDDDTLRSAERSVQRLLNPCNCKHTGICKCCEPKRPSRKARRSSNTNSPLETEDLIDIFRSKAGPSSDQHLTSPISPSPSSASTSVSRYSFSQHLPVPDISPENPHHPAHTSKHVHKTKLYSPYTHSSASRHAKRESITRSISGISNGSISPTGSVTPKGPLKVPPLDMTAFLGALLDSNGSVVNEVSRKALGLPGIQTFDSLVKNDGQVKLEAMDLDPNSPSPFDNLQSPMPITIEEDVDMPLAFPTLEDVVVGACTCGPDCNCPGCTTHPYRPGSSLSDNAGCCSSKSPSQDHSYGPGQQKEGCDEQSCQSCFDCTGHLYIPPGMTSIEQMLSVAASQVPQPTRTRSIDLQGTDTSILPPSASFSPDAAATAGFIQLKPLECCNGRCQCQPGNCVCDKECCGCCERCACGEDAPTPTPFNQESSSSSTTGKRDCCSSTGTSNAQNIPATVSNEGGSSCCAPRNSIPNLTISTTSPLPGSPYLLPSASDQGLLADNTLNVPGLSSPARSPSISPNNLSPGYQSSSASSSAHHSPLLSPMNSLNFGSSNHTSPHLQPTSSVSSSSSPIFNFDSFRLPSPGPALPQFGGDNEAIPSLRRASSSTQKYGHSHSQSLSSSGRRATVTASGSGVGAGIQRSASTGKQASKALALNQTPNHPQHSNVRPIVPKPISTHLAPPKNNGVLDGNSDNEGGGGGQTSGSGSSRPISPISRRRSSTSARNSRAPSPLPLESNTGIAGPSNYNQNQNQDQYNYHQQRHSESNIIPSFGNLDMSMPVPLLTTSAPGQTAQPFDYNNMNSGVNPDNPSSNQVDGEVDPALAAYLQQIMSDPIALQAFMDNMENMTQQQTNLPINGSIPNNQDNQGSSVTFDNSFMNFGASESIGGQSAAFGPMFSTNYQPDLLGSIDSHERVRAGLMAQHQAVLQALQPQNVDVPQPLPYTQDLTPGPGLSATALQSQQQDHLQPHQQQPFVRKPKRTASTDPDIIDLTKPLSADHVERILKALQQQQASTADNSTIQTSLPVNQNPEPSSLQQSKQLQQNMHGQVPPPNNPLISPSTSAPTSNPFGYQPAQSIPTQYQPSTFDRTHQPSFSQSSFDSFLLAPNSNPSSSGPSSANLDQNHLQTENIFEKYLVDNLEEGLVLADNENGYNAFGIENGIEGKGKVLDVDSQWMFNGSAT